MTLAVGCYTAEDGSQRLRSFPAVDCTDGALRLGAGWGGGVIFCLGIPCVCLWLTARFHLGHFVSGRASFLVQSVFSGLVASPSGFIFRIWVLLRVWILAVSTRVSGLVYPLSLSDSISGSPGDYR